MKSVWYRKCHNPWLVRVCCGCGPLGMRWFRRSSSEWNVLACCKAISCLWHAQWRRGRASGAIPSPLNFSQLDIFRVWKFSFKKYNVWGWKFPILGEFGGMIEILSSRNLLYWKFADVCRKFSTSCLFPQPFNRRRRWTCGTHCGCAGRVSQRLYSQDDCGTMSVCGFVQSLTCCCVRVFRWLCACDIYDNAVRR